MADTNPALTPISALGEFGLIHHLTQNIRLNNTGTLLGTGDDAAIVQASEGVQSLISTDLLVEGVHFDISYTPLTHLGYKAVSVNVSDMAAMNAVPKQITVGLAISSKYTVEAMEELYRGILAACEHYHIDLVGGDTTSSTSGLFISVTIIGEAKADEIVRRKGANKGDLICVTGDLGGAFLGLNLLEREKRIYRESPEVQPDFGDYDYLLQRQLKPEARVDMRDIFAQLGVKPSSMIDVSDGLASELMHLCTQNQLGCKVYEEKFPLDPMAIKLASEFNFDINVAVLNGGEDYELLFTVTQDDYAKIKGHPDITVIGHMTDETEGRMLVTRGLQAHELQAQGWNHFKK
jgi:thiamine-monophosphate kinase